MKPYVNNFKQMFGFIRQITSSSTDKVPTKIKRADLRARKKFHNYRKSQGETLRSKGIPIDWAVRWRHLYFCENQDKKIAGRS